MPLPLRQLEAFHAVVANGSMTKAATFLEISQPAVSRLVSSLEDNLGFHLFERVSGRLRPTPESRSLFDEVEKALANLKHISRLIENIHDNKSAHLRVACLPGFATTVLPQLLAIFMKDRPGLTLTMEPRSPQKIQEWVSARQFDVGITERFEKSPAIEYESINIRTVFIAPLGHPLAKKKVVTPQDLDGVSMIHTNPNNAIFIDLQQAFNDAGAKYSSLVETRQFAPACIMVAENIGVSVVSEIDARQYEKKGLVIRPFEPEIPFQLNIIYPSFMPRSIATREFVEAFKESIKPYCL